jgi:hypothetical protein
MTVVYPPAAAASGVITSGAATDTAGAPAMALEMDLQGARLVDVRGARRVPRGGQAAAPGLRA